MGKDDKDNNNNEGMPDISSLKVAAIQMHELYTSFREAGFSEKQALELTIKVTLGTMGA